MPLWSPRRSLRRLGDLRRSEVATFAAGCFWGVEAEFRELDGVIDTTVGYCGGFIADPSHQEVCAGETGHAEAVRVVFAPAMVSYESLLATFWQIHDPTQVGHQGFDIGEQYRSAVFTHSADQLRRALGSRATEQRSRAKPIVTEVIPAGRFYRAEAHHQQLYERDSTGALGGTYTLTDLKSWLAVADPHDPSDRTGVTHEAGDSRRS